LITIVGVALSLVIIAPVALSSQDLYKWAGDGLGLDGPAWRLMVFLALDACAVVCIAVVVIASWISVPAPVFSLLVWLFAIASGFANWRQGATSDAPDAQWFFPLMSILGPALLEACLAFLRKVMRREQAALGAERLTTARWLLAPRSTWSAWRLTVLDRRLTVSEALDRVDPRRPGRTPQDPPNAPEPPAQTVPEPRRPRRQSVPVHTLTEMALTIPPSVRASRDALAEQLRQRGVPISTDKATQVYNALNGATA
jgi:hypothetical protein